MPVLNAASIDYSLLAGAESLNGSKSSSDGSVLRKRQTANEESSSSSSASTTSASSPPTSDDDEEEVRQQQQARKLQQERDETEKNKYSFRTPKKVISQVCISTLVLMGHTTSDLSCTFSPDVLTMFNPTRTKHVHIHRTRMTGCGCTTKSRIDLEGGQS